MNQRERMLTGMLYNSYKVEDNAWEKSRGALEKFNSMSWRELRKGMELECARAVTIGNDVWIGGKSLPDHQRDHGSRQGLLDGPA